MKNLLYFCGKDGQEIGFKEDREKKKKEVLFKSYWDYQLDIKVSCFIRDFKKGNNAGSNFKT